MCWVFSLEQRSKLHSFFVPQNWNKKLDSVKMSNERTRHDVTAKTWNIKNSTFFHDVWLYCLHVLKSFQPCGHYNYSDPFHGPVAVWIQRNDFTQKVSSHQVCEKLLWGFFLHRCSQGLHEDPWGFGEGKTRPTEKRVIFSVWVFPLKFITMTLTQTPLPV